MNTSLIATITAISGFFVSLASLFINFWLNRKLESYHAKEALSSQLHVEYLKSYLLSLSDGKDRELESFRTLLKCGQIFRDKLNTIILSPKSYGTKTLETELFEIVTAFNNTYADQQIFLPEEARQIIHNLKKRCEQLVPSILATVETNQNINVLQNEADEIEMIHRAFRERSRIAIDSFLNSLDRNHIK